jgi:hypothetical protein
MKYVARALRARTGLFCEQIHKPRLAGKSHQAGEPAQVLRVIGELRAMIE